MLYRAGTAPDRSGTERSRAESDRDGAEPNRYRAGPRRSGAEPEQSGAEPELNRAGMERYRAELGWDRICSDRAGIGLAMGPLDLIWIQSTAYQNKRIHLQIKQKSCLPLLFVFATFGAEDTRKTRGRRAEGAKCDDLLFLGPSAQFKFVHLGGN